MLFEEIIGLSDIKDTLLASVRNGHIAHAQLFLGNAGSANLALALAYSQYLNCENPQAHDACGTCAACYKTHKLIHPDLHFVFPVNKTKNIKEEHPRSVHFLADWRKFISENPYQSLSDWMNFIEAESKQALISVHEARDVVQQLSLKTFEGKYKIMLIWQPEILNLASANALLKILEEPPPQTVFLLVCNAAENLLSTILSRTQLINIPDFSDEEIVQNLVSQFGFESAQARKISLLADGNMHLALQLAKGTPDENFDFFAKWMRKCFGYKIAELLEDAENFQKMNKDEQKSLLLYSLDIFRNCLLATAGGNSLVKLPENLRIFVEKLALQLNANRIEMLYQSFNESIYHLERNANPKILFFELSLQIAAVFKR
jgi:DNA polymerase III subunit delta'